MNGNRPAQRPLRLRLAWFALFWVGGVAVVAALAYVIRFLMAA